MKEHEIVGWGFDTNSASAACTTELALWVTHLFCWLLIIHFPTIFMWEPSGSFREVSIFKQKKKKKIPSTVAKLPSKFVRQQCWKIRVLLVPLKSFFYDFGFNGCTTSSVYFLSRNVPEAQHSTPLAVSIAKEITCSYLTWQSLTLRLAITMYVYIYI